jgi:hypothetical protein
LDPLGKGNGSTHPRQNHAQAKRANHQITQELPLHICKLPLNKCQLWAQTGQAGSHNRSGRFHQNWSDRFSKPVGPISHRPHPQKPKMQKKCTSSPLALGIGSKDAMQLFSTFLSPPCYQCMNQGSNFKKMQPRASQVYKIHHKMLHMSK